VGQHKPIKGEMWFDVLDPPVFAVAGMWKQVGDRSVSFSNQPAHDAFEAANFTVTAVPEPARGR